MEKYMKSCRMIFICEHIHKLIAPIRSRCVCLRVGAPTKDDILPILKTVSKKVLYDPGEEIIGKIVENCNRNLRTALMQLQVSRHTKEKSIIAPYSVEIK